MILGAAHCKVGMPGSSSFLFTGVWMMITRVWMMIDTVGSLLKSCGGIVEYRSDCLGDNGRG